MVVLIPSRYLLLFITLFSVFTRHYWGVNAEVRKKVIVQTTSGLVEGEQGGVFNNSNKSWYRFRGIPFAEPPVGNLRFEPAVPKQPWEGVLDTTTRGDVCIQSNDPVVGSENCLFVKIYTPQPPNKRNKLPVLVWVYGGAFYMGAPDFDGGNPEPLLEQNVIVASFHYRVGLFGFLSTGDSILPGNVGLKDQVLALTWIKKNIENFGGDAEKITIFGQSAGGASISYLLQAPQTKGLYNGAIMLSGNSLDSWALSRKPLDFAKSVASTLRVTTRNIKNMVEGLKQVSVTELQKATASRYNRALLNDPTGGLPLGPVVESEHPGAIITGRSHDLLKNGHFNKVPIMIGHTSLEARTGNELSSALKLLLATYELVPGRLVPVGMHVSNPIRRSIVGQKIKSHYFGRKLITSSTLEAYRLISEDQFVRGIHESVVQYSKRVPVYYYNFAYEGALFGVQNRTLPGVGHSEDLAYLFKFPFNGSETDYLVRSRFGKLVTNFAKYKDPTPRRESLLQNIQWPANTGHNNIKLLNITNKLEVIANPYSDNMIFWNNTFDRYGQPPFDTF